ncbi:hypothetical protein DYBT9623_05290 [Dyadobacter sp. CECT 9623]|uniref:Uncharacterized protein n=1 Tax=Dyadobacter linearis TaxID=2823330 RepID=A0ABM8UY52_9BACT|nr:hypothetical protein DYBT9623_05290 [Dyadobacter sp. CECT 9623]
MAGISLELYSALTPIYVVFPTTKDENEKG